ncbi:Hypothetical protein KNT65_gp146 [Escherichia phage EcS1]|uniref:Uncharacterized protein n=1 Tax=Escherichia phage EcS1 TaxID=2083276 RepID=A0A2Z5ZCK2_9CAUD|nr:Hypothetical protein KNT65_gp146 [Escherichia phage EcS1]BBC78194.1 Hypothetical protein [Escherichia phage EcS1]
MFIFTNDFRVFYANKQGQEHALSVGFITPLLHDNYELSKLDSYVVKALIALNSLPLSERNNMFYEGDGVWTAEPEKFKIPSNVTSAGGVLMMQQLIDTGAPNTFLHYIVKHIERQSTDKIRMHQYAIGNKIPAPVYVKDSKTFLKVIKDVSCMSEGIKFLGLRAYEYSLMHYNDAANHFIKPDSSKYSTESLYGAWFEARIEGKTFRFALCMSVYNFESSRGSYSDKNRQWFLEDLPEQMKSFVDHDKGVNLLAVEEFVKMCRTKHVEVK